MQALLALSRAIDRLNAFVGRYCIWLIFAATVISAANAVVRKIFNYSSNAFLEVQWYLYAWSFLIAAGYTLLQREHVRIDVLNSRLSKRTQVWIDIFGFLFFLTPVCILVLWLGVPMLISKFQSGEVSGNPGGLIRWPVWVALPVGFALLMLQGWSELIKRIAFLKGVGPDPMGRLTDKSDEEALIEALRLQTEQERQAGTAAPR
ncbi:TRAP transporter small permease subunit [Melaminivora alkalimesophila]|uniref:TRAP transporter small permease protein n=1 Tax=Melaminivora alkalimesophila TaxID=1165852 RepID=A0A317RI94_9BURK|nr:TRAP transporter small permease subunit [Melaminivora alkalimesophila]PWW48806.1 TRAP-type mannitol/chloroaromatic compound transport system permease small subunit [Melaminivora alkalimesophila]